MKNNDKYICWTENSTLAPLVSISEKKSSVIPNKCH